LSGKNFKQSLQQTLKNPFSPFKALDEASKKISPLKVATESSFIYCITYLINYAFLHTVIPMSPTADGTRIWEKLTNKRVPSLNEAVAFLLEILIPAAILATKIDKGKESVC